MTSSENNEILNKIEINNLKFVKLRIPGVIPREFIDAVKGRTFTPEQFYDYQHKQIDNPYNHLYALVDNDHKIHGYLWAEMNILDNSLFVNTFSISKEYWGRGEAISKAIEFLVQLKDKIKAERVFWVTTNEKFFLKRGFKRSKNVLMECG